jgi:hypothetical protein
MKKNAKLCSFDVRKHNTLNTVFIRPEPPGTHTKITITDRYGTIHELEESHLERDFGILINDKIKWRHQEIQVKSKSMTSLSQLKKIFK